VAYLVDSTEMTRSLGRAATGPWILMLIICLKTAVTSEGESVLRRSKLLESLKKRKRR